MLNNAHNHQQQFQTVMIDPDLISAGVRFFWSELTTSTPLEALVSKGCIARLTFLIEALKEDCRLNTAFAGLTDILGEERRNLALDKLLQILENVNSGAELDLVAGLCKETLRIVEDTADLPQARTVQKPRHDGKKSESTLIANVPEDILNKIADAITKLNSKPRMETLCASTLVNRHWSTVFRDRLWTCPRPISNPRTQARFAMEAYIRSKVGKAPNCQRLEIRWYARGINTWLISRMMESCQNVRAILFHRGDNDDFAERVSLSDQEALLEWLDHLNKLKELSLLQFSYHDDLAPSAEEMAAPVPIVPDATAKTLNRLDFLDLYGVSWIWPYLLSSLSSSCSLSQLHIGISQMKVPFQAISQIALFLSNLKSYRFSSFGIASTGGEWANLIPILEVTHATLEELTICSMESMTWLTTWLPKMVSLRSLDLSGNEFLISDTTLFSSLTKLGRLGAGIEEIHVSGLLLTSLTLDGSSSALAEMIRANADTLRRLDLDCDFDFSENAELIATGNVTSLAVLGALAQCHQLEIVDIGLPSGTLWREIRGEGIHEDFLVDDPDERDNAITDFLNGCPNLQISEWVHKVCSGHPLFEGSVKAHLEQAVKDKDKEEDEYFEEQYEIIGC